MTLDPIIQAPIAVQLHVATVLPAFAIGAWLIFVSRKGSRHHRLLGKVFLGLMVATSTSLAARSLSDSGHRRRGGQGLQKWHSRCSVVVQGLSCARGRVGSSAARSIDMANLADRVITAALGRSPCVRVGLGN
jgi:hypothetical protein